MPPPGRRHSIDGSTCAPGSARAQPVRFSDPFIASSATDGRAGGRGLPDKQPSSHPPVAGQYGAAEANQRLAPFHKCDSAHQQDPNPAVRNPPIHLDLTPVPTNLGPQSHQVPVARQFVADPAFRQGQDADASSQKFFRPERSNWYL